MAGESVPVLKSPDCGNMPASRREALLSQLQDSQPPVTSEELKAGLASKTALPENSNTVSSSGSMSSSTSSYGLSELKAEAHLGALFMSTTVQAGHGRGVVVATGMQTDFGRTVYCAPSVYYLCKLQVCATCEITLVLLHFRSRETQNSVRAPSLYFYSCFPCPLPSLALSQPGVRNEGGGAAQDPSASVDGRPGPAAQRHELCRDWLHRARWCVICGVFVVCNAFTLL